MTLSVRAYYVNAQGIRQDIPLASDLAGFESARSNFYGSFARECGAKLLPLLSEQAVLQIGGATLRELRAEIASLQRAIIGRDDRDYWSFRLTNISAAIDSAESHGNDGWVEIA